jgi:vacuolar-type H+-ATPase subunit F/Vma7
MVLAIYLGDEVSAAGFRLAGVDARVPERGEEAQVLARARTEASLVLLSATFATRVPAAELGAAQLARAPLTVIVPDLQGETPLPDVASRLRAELGLAS